jgi:hypothetical protein
MAAFWAVIGEIAWRIQRPIHSNKDRNQPMTATWLPARFLLSVLLVWLFALGCAKRSSMPKTYSVTGTVVYKDGKSVVAGTNVTLAPLTEASFSVSGDVNADGTFTLFTVKDADKEKGAPEGEYRVTITPPIPADRAKGPRQVPQSFTLSKTVKVEAKDNTLTIDVDPQNP